LRSFSALAWAGWSGAYFLDSEKVFSRWAIMCSVVDDTLAGWTLMELQDGLYDTSLLGIQSRPTAHVRLNRVHDDPPLLNLQRSGCCHPVPLVHRQVTAPSIFGNY
jgi:hypothetical protein